MLGKMNFVTGGTTQEPRIIEYTDERWQDSINRKRSVLEAHGIGMGARVLVVFPFSPWSIGSVFSEAAFRSGADVYPFGLSAVSNSFYKMIVEKVRPTHICGSPRLIAKMAKEIDAGPFGSLRRAQTVKKIFVAGERLHSSLRKECEALWNSEVVNIYGMAELDMVGAELPGATHIHLATEFTYSLLISGVRRKISVGASGELSIQAKEDKVGWFDTQDIVEVIGRDRSENALWPGAWRIRIINRTNDSATLSDGTLITSEHVDIVRSRFKSIKDIQITLTHNDNLDHIDILCATENSICCVSEKDVVDALIDSNIDLADAVAHRVVASITVKFGEESSLAMTSRGKVKAVIEKNAYESC